MPVAFRLFKDPEPLYAKLHLIDFIYAAQEVPRDAHALFLDYVLQANPTEAVYIFSHWQGISACAAAFRQAACLVRPSDVFQRIFASALDPSSWSDLGLFIDNFKARRLVLPRAEIRRLLHGERLGSSLDECDVPNLV